VAPAPQGAVPVQAPTPPGGAVAEAVQEKARMVDEKLWEGAAAAGWQLHQKPSGGYIYTAPNGTRYTNQKEAKLYPKKAAPAPPPRVQWAGAKGSSASGGRGRGHGGRGRGAGVQKQSRGRSPVALEPRSHAPEAQPLCPQPSPLSLLPCTN
jgi:hypothetical protein